MKTDQGWDKLNKGAPYHVLLERAQRKSAKKMKERMDAAMAAKRERKKKGISIFIQGIKHTSSYV